jgi:molybdate transport system regulatory protein
MNKLEATITAVQQHGAIMLIDAEACGQGFSALLIEPSADKSWLAAGCRVELVFKETEVSLAKNLSGRISMRNRMQCTVIEIERGQLLSTVSLDFKQHKIQSSITTRSADALQLCPGDTVEALVKANEISAARLKP